MRKHKECYVVAYDVALSKSRLAVAKVLKKYGHRVNKSVFECMVTSAGIYKMKQEILEIIDLKKDSVIFYQLCLNCFTRAEYYPPKKEDVKIVKIIA